MPLWIYTIKRSYVFTFFLVVDKMYGHNYWNDFVRFFFFYSMFCKPKMISYGIFDSSQIKRINSQIENEIFVWLWLTFELSHALEWFVLPLETKVLM